MSRRVAVRFTWELQPRNNSANLEIPPSLEETDVIFGKHGRQFPGIGFNFWLHTPHEWNFFQRHHSFGALDNKNEIYFGVEPFKLRKIMWTLLHQEAPFASLKHSYSWMTLGRELNRKEGSVWNFIPTWPNLSFLAFSWFVQMQFGSSCLWSIHHLRYCLLDLHGSPTKSGSFRLRLRSTSWSV